MQPLLTSLLSRDPTKRPSIDITVCLDLISLMLSLSKCSLLPSTPLGHHRLVRH